MLAKFWFCEYCAPAGLMGLKPFFVIVAACEL